MTPPSYSDLGKSARDLFNKGFNFGFLKIDSTTSAHSEAVEFKSAASHNIDTGKLFGSLDFKYMIPDYGITLTEKWNTDNTLGTEILCEDKLTKGLKMTLDSTFAPHLGKRTGKIKVEHECDQVHLNTDMSLDVGPIINASAVFGRKGWLVGYQTGYDTQNAKMTSSNIAFGRETSDYAIHTFINDSQEFGGSLYHKVSPKLELAASLGWTAGEEMNRFGLAAKYNVQQDWTLRAKLNNTSQVALSMTHQLNPDLSLTMSTLMNLRQFQEGGHKFGIGFEYKP
jgi:voltage-dependent anion channel protein 2